MIKMLSYDLTILTFRQILAKYGVPLMIGIIVLTIVGQLLLMRTPLDSLLKVKGRIVNVERKHIQSGSSESTAVVISLDHSRSFMIMDKNDTANLVNSLKPGDQVTIYCPNHRVNLLSLGNAHDVLQLERGQQVFFSWKSQQAKGWTLIYICIFLLFFSWYLKLQWSKPVST